MFHSARIKLTALYLAIIFCVSFMFSVAIYTMLTAELNRIARVQRLRVERRLIIANAPLPRPDSDGLPILDPEVIEETKQRIIIVLIGINGAILVIAGGLGYLLAGRTLKPIADMMEEQNRFVGDSSHELRTPLTALKSSLEVALRDQNLSLEDAKHAIEDAIGDVDRLKALSDSLLTLAHFNKPTPPAMTELHLKALIAGGIRDTGGLAKQKHITVKTSGKDAAFTGNGDMLHDLLVILLDNAIKYSPARSTVTVSSASGSGEVTIAVSDRGIGIGKEDLPHIFDRFFRADASRSTQGYGLGLSIAKKIAETHKGTISVDSEPGHGSTFTVHLPTA